MARKRKQKRPADQELALAARSARFRLRYQDGVAELGMGCMLLLLTLLNLSEYLFADEVLVHFLLMVQPILSLLLFAGGLFLIRALREKVLSKRNVEHIPLTQPIFWITLMMLFLLIAAPLVWPSQQVDAGVITWVLGGLGCVAGLIVLILGVHHQFQRFILIGGVIFVLCGLFTFIGQPGSLVNQLVILLGISGTFLISGGYTLWQFLQGVDLYR